MKTAVDTLPENARKTGRITIWLLLPPHVRRIALWAAGMPASRADDELTTFTSIERARITAALQSMLTSLTMAEQCMNDSDVTTRTTLVLH